MGGLVSGPSFLSFLFHVGEGEEEAGSSGDMAGLFFPFFSLGLMCCPCIRRKARFDRWDCCWCGLDAAESGSV